MIKDTILANASIINAPAETLTAPGQIAFSNVSTTAQAVEWMPEAVIGLVKQNGLVEARKFIAPDWRSVYSNTEASYPYFERKESFKTAEYDSIKRGLGGEFKYASQFGTRKSVVLENIGLSVALEKSLAQTDPDYKARNAQMLVDIIESATLLEALKHLDAIADASTDWSVSGDVSPDALLTKTLREAGDKAGKRPNRLLFGGKAWDLRNEWLDKQVTAGGFIRSRTEAELSSYLRTDVYIPDARTANAGAFPEIAEDKVYGFLGYEGTPQGDVSNVKTIIGKDGGLKVTEFDHPQGELLLVTVSRWQAVVTTASEGAFAITCSE